MAAPSNPTTKLAKQTAAQLGITQVAANNQGILSSIFVDKDGFLVARKIDNTFQYLQTEGGQKVTIHGAVVV